MANSNSSLETALKNLAAAAQEVANAIDEVDYKLSESAPEYLKDPDEFAYEITQFVEDEIEELSPIPK